jgi:hypothetical protein
MKPAFVLAVMPWQQGRWQALFLASDSLSSGRTALDQPRPVGFQVNYHAVDPAHLGSSQLAQIPQHLVMDQHFPKRHDPNVAFFCPPELPLGQGR